MEQQWDPDLVEATYIKDLKDNLSIIRLRFGENSKPLFHNREFIVYERRETMDDGTLVSSLTLKKGYKKRVRAKVVLPQRPWTHNNSQNGPKQFCQHYIFYGWSPRFRTFLSNHSLINSLLA